MAPWADREVIRKDRRVRASTIGVRKSKCSLLSRQTILSSRDEAPNPANSRLTGNLGTGSNISGYGVYQALGLAMATSEKTLPGSRSPTPRQDAFAENLLEGRTNKGEALRLEDTKQIVDANSGIVRGWPGQQSAIDPRS